MRALLTLLLTMPLVAGGQERDAWSEVAQDFADHRVAVLIHPGSLVEGTVGLEVTTVGGGAWALSVTPLVHFTALPVPTEATVPLMSIPTGGANAGVIAGIRYGLSPSARFAPALAFELGLSHFRGQATAGTTFLSLYTLEIDAWLYSASCQLLVCRPLHPRGGRLRVLSGW